MTSALSDAETGSRSGVVSEAAQLRGRLRLPSDKSVSHRALLFDALGSGEAEVSLYRPGGDVLSMVGALATLGAVRGTTTDPAGATVVMIRGGDDEDAARLAGTGGETLDCGNAGTAMRLLAGALAGRPSTATLIGDASLSDRPMDRVAGPLRSMGADVTTTDGHAPLTIRGTRSLRAMEHDLPMASAQVLGCIALAALAADGRTTIRLPGPTRDHTERMLAWLGVPIRRDGLVTTVEGPIGFAARPMTAPGDISSAAAWLVAGALHPSADLTIEGVGLNPSRVGIVEVLREMGADITVEAEPAHAGPEPVGTIRIRGGGPLHAVDIAADRVADVIDELPLIGVAMAAAEGRSELRDAAELRVKESDRIALVCRNLAAIGAEVEELPDGWRVRRGRVPSTTHAIDIVTGGDHRIAMAFAVAALAGLASPMRIDDPGCVSVSYPGFWHDLVALTEVSARPDPVDRSP